MSIFRGIIAINFERMAHQVASVMNARHDWQRLARSLDHGIRMLPSRGMVRSTASTSAGSTLFPRTLMMYSFAPRDKIRLYLPSQVSRIKYRARAGLIVSRFFSTFRHREIIESYFATCRVSNALILAQNAIGTVQMLGHSAANSPNCRKCV